MLRNALRFWMMSMVLISTLKASTERPLESISHVSLEQYLGKWYEIARYENSFEKGCVGATAEYTMDANHLRIINRCYDAKGAKLDEANGRGYPVENSGNAKLRVTFFWQFYGDYWIVKLASDYRYAVVGEPSRKYLWILAREKTLSQEDTEAILASLPTLGYDTSLLYWTKN